MNNLKFEVQTQIMNQVRNLNSGRHYLQNLMSDFEVDPEKQQEIGGAVGSLISKNSLA
jgi:hypothetical protein